MQFVRNGPDIPERLLQLHEEGRVVFFCGAGISFPAKLPTFAGLVNEVYARLGVTADPVQMAAVKAHQYDTAIGLLEASIVGGREVVRRALASILTPNLTAPHALSTHEALLDLALTRGGNFRLITTNFDRLFEHAATAKSLTLSRFCAPLLPVPKNRWHGLVYLHGLLQEAPTARDLDCLVASSGDFGLAYLTERWAARFVSELFRNYTVCFIGYSINDPVLRYMMDALAADRLLGESPPEMFAFGSYSRGTESERANEWLAKNVTPILYSEYKRHAHLHNTLRNWSATYRDGVRGKEQIVVRFARAHPMVSTIQDDFVGRMLWALADPMAMPAKAFADFDPVPSLDWLTPLSEDRYKHLDLVRFGIPPSKSIDTQLAFSVIRRPTPYRLSPWMRIVGPSFIGAQWDEVMFHLARWLTRHLDDPKLVLWLAKHGGQPHQKLVDLINHKLSELHKLQTNGSYQEIALLRSNAPNAIPRPAMRTLWRLMMSGRLQSKGRELDFYDWLRRCKREGLKTSLRLELHEILTPRVTLRQPFAWPEPPDQPDALDSPQNLKQIVDWDIVLSAGHLHYALKDLSNSDWWREALPYLLTDANGLLRDVLDLMSELGGATAHSDHSYISQPSIAPHPQNAHHQDWTVLIEITRDAWLETARQNLALAQATVDQWWFAPYPLFKRLVFFAAAQGEIIAPTRALEWLLADDNWWLWSVETQREATRLIVALSQKMPDQEWATLEEAILAGPPRAMFKTDIPQQAWTDLVRREVWLRLAKAKNAGATLGLAANETLTSLSLAHPAWTLATDERDEFPVWTGVGNEFRQFLTTPRRRKDLVEWLMKHREMDFWQEDDWRKRCRDDFATTTTALYALARMDQWLVERWETALQAWAEERLLKPSWRRMAKILSDAPAATLVALSNGISFWLRGISRVFENGEAMFLKLVRTILSMNHPDVVSTDDPVTRAINNPVGHVTEALLNWWYRGKLEDNQGLPDVLKAIFTEVCDDRINKFRHGRVLLSAQLISLFRVDPAWTNANLMPLFDWDRSPDEASAAWQGFLWSPRWHPPLMERMRVSFLDTAHHYSAIEDHGKQYASFLTFIALEQSDTFTNAEIADATRSLPSEGLTAAAHVLVQSIGASGEQAADHWLHRIRPYIESIFPRSRDRATPELSESFARLCTATRDAFPDALRVLRHWLQPLQRPDVVINLLAHTQICTRFPLDALEFLDIITNFEERWPPTELKACLTSIRESSPDLIENDNRYLRIADYMRRMGA